MDSLISNPLLINPGIIKMGNNFVLSAVAEQSVNCDGDFSFNEDSVVDAMVATTFSIEFKWIFRVVVIIVIFNIRLLFIC